MLCINAGDCTRHIAIRRAVLASARSLKFLKSFLLRRRNPMNHAIYVSLSLVQSHLHSQTIATTASRCDQSSNYRGFVRARTVRIRATPERIAPRETSTRGASLESIAQYAVINSQLALARDKISSERNPARESKGGDDFCTLRHTRDDIRFRSRARDRSRARAD